MKKTLSVAIIALLFIAGPLMSQKQLYFGLAGTGLSSVITNQNNYGLPFEMDYAFTMGGSGNANIGFDFSNNIGLKLEIGYSILGQKYTDTYNDTVYSRNIKLNYLQIPLLFKFRTGGDVAKFYLLVGPQLNLLLSASQKYLKQDDIFNENFTPSDWTKPVLIGQETITDRYNSMDIMGRLDIGVDINLAKSLFLNVGLTMAYGFTDINATDWQIKDHTGNYNPSHNIYGGINFGINYVLPIGSK
jgi:hypothetical protein